MMEDNNKSQTTEIQSVLPDVVHSQQISGASGNDNGGTCPRNSTHDPGVSQTNNPELVVTTTSETESVSELLPSRIDFSLSEGLPDLEIDNVYSKVSNDNLAIKTENSYAQNPSSNDPQSNEVSYNNASWNVANTQNISEESPVHVVLPSDVSGEQMSIPPSPLKPESLSLSRSNQSETSENFLGEKPTSNEDISSGSDVIKLDIRGSATQKIIAEKIIFGPPPEGSDIMDEPPLPSFQNLLQPIFIKAGEDMVVEEVFNLLETSKDVKTHKEVSPQDSFTSDKSERDVLVEELTINDSKTKDLEEESQPQLKSLVQEEPVSFTTMTTDYRNIHEGYLEKLIHLEDAITQRDTLIDELTNSLQRSVQERENLKQENDHLAKEVQMLQHIVAEHSITDHDTIKGQLSDFMRYETMKDESTKFYSAIMSGGSSVRSSNGEKDMDNEELTVNYSKSVDTSQSSNDFHANFENKLLDVISQYEEFNSIADNIRNKIREDLIRLFNEEMSKVTTEYDKEVKQLETQLQQCKSKFTTETRKLRELVASVKSGNVDIDAVREELSIKHEKEMEDLRTYFEKKCSDMERSYSEEVYRDVAAAAAGEAGAGAGAAGDAPSLNSTSLQAVQLDSTDPLKKFDQQLEEMKAEHITYVAELQTRHNEAIAALEDQIVELKAHIQTAENTVTSVPLYQQDIDSELEKKPDKVDIEDIRKQVRLEVSEQLQEQIQVLLSDPDAELSSWPLELVALRDKLHGDRSKGEKEPPTLCEELSPSDSDKWRQRRNHSFDQNRRLEDVTKERDELKRAAVTLGRAVTQLVAYCAAADAELNQTVLEPLARALVHTALPSESRPTSPSSELNLSCSGGKHVHFAPDLPAVLAQLDEDALLAYLQEQHDLSLEIKHELEISLQRLRSEAQDLLELSCKLGKNRLDTSRMLEPSIRITELVEEIDSRSQNQFQCHDCSDMKRNMEEAMSECVQRECLLREKLEAAMMQVAHLVVAADRRNTDVIEGYGLARGPHSLPSRRVPPGPASPPSPPSPPLASPHTPRTPDNREGEVEALLKEKDDLVQQLEAANRQLRSARQFIEEQALEREAEREEATRAAHCARADIARLHAKLHANATILTEMQQMHCLQLRARHLRERDNQVEQLEAQTREMNQIITDLEQRKLQTDDEIQSQNEKISILRDIIANLETQIEQKNAHEKEIVDEVEKMREAIEDRDSKLRSVVKELEELRSEKTMCEGESCGRCAEREEAEQELMDKIKEQMRCLEESLQYRTSVLERVHESSTCSDHTEDVSIADQKHAPQEVCVPPSAAGECGALVCGVWSRLEAHARADAAAIKYIADLTRAAQEVRAERDVLQTRMSEQALKLSSLAARLELQRSHAAAAASAAAGDLTVKLHDATAEVQRLTEELEAKNVQLNRLKKALEERDSYSEKYEKLCSNVCNPQDKVIILERELFAAQQRAAELEAIVKEFEAKEEGKQDIEDLKLEDKDDKSKSEIIEAAKTSARTLSDIVSISDYDEQDLQMRKAELKPNMNLTGIPYPNETKDKSPNNITLLPDVSKLNMSSLRLENTDHFDTNYTPRADTYPILTSTQNKDVNYKRNTNETTIFGIGFGEIKTAEKIQDNCSMFPNRDVDDSKDVSLEPKKINFSMEPSHETKSHDDSISLKDLGITLEVKEGNLPDILTQLKNVIKKSKSEIENYKTELRNAEEQLCEFPVLKEEVEELKQHLEETMAAMTNDKKFYENQLENFTSNKKLIEKRLAELTQEVSDKTKDLHLLKEDILRRENMVLELAKEKRNLTNKMAELEVKIDELQSRNAALEKYEQENVQMKEKVSKLNKLESLVSEKNQQIDSLNQHLDRFDDLQRNLNDRTEELENLKEAFEEKSNELFQIQDTVEALNKDLASVNEDNDKLNLVNTELKHKLSKLEKEQENHSLKLQSSENEINRLESLNTELITKIDELKQLHDKLQDKETEIELLNEDINLYHEEIATLKEQLKVSRSPSPRNKSVSEDRTKMADRQASNDKKQLGKIRKQISLLQHELDFNKKELNHKAFELAKAKLDLTEQTTELSQANKQIYEASVAIKQLEDSNLQLKTQLEEAVNEKRSLAEQLALVTDRIREESNTEELKQKLRSKTEQCRVLEREVQHLQDALARIQPEQTEANCRALVLSGTRSPTAELERAVREQLHYSHTLDDDIMEQILSASSDNEEIPRLALNLSKSSSSPQSSSSERLNRLRAENDKLTMQVNNLEARLKDKDALITELNRIRDKLVGEWQAACLRGEAERDNNTRLHALLATQRDAADTLQSQDTNMIGILKKRLESSMRNEAILQEELQECKTRVTQLESQLLHAQGGEVAEGIKKQLQIEMESKSRLKSEISSLRSALEVERSRYVDLQTAMEQNKLRAQRDGAAHAQQCSQLRTQIVELTRLKHDASVELLRAKELLNIQSAAIAEMEQKIAEQNNSPRVTELSDTKSTVLREISDLKRHILDAQTASKQNSVLREKVLALEGELKARGSEDKEQAIRYLHGRCLRLESWRKALAWQKRYLQRVLAGYAAMEARLAVNASPLPVPPITKFRSAVRCVSAICRMQFLVSRRRRSRAAAARALFRPRDTSDLPTHSLLRSPPARERPASLHVPRPEPHDDVTRSPCYVNSPRDEPFLLNSPRNEAAAAYLNKLDLVSRCLNQALDSPRT